MKVKFVFLCLLVASSLNLHAQENPFVGAWQLTGIAEDAGYSFQKYFNEKGEFYNMQTVGDKATKTHHGKYVIKSKSEYWELIATDTEGFMANEGGKTAHVYYTFSEDKRLLMLKADPVPGNNGWQETWRRIEVEKVVGRIGPNANSMSAEILRSNYFWFKGNKEIYNEFEAKYPAD